MARAGSYIVLHCVAHFHFSIFRSKFYLSHLQLLEEENIPKAFPSVWSEQDLVCRSGGSSWTGGFRRWQSYGLVSQSSIMFSTSRSHQSQDICSNFSPACFNITGSIIEPSGRLSYRWQRFALQYSLKYSHCQAVSYLRQDAPSQNHFSPWTSF